MEAPNGPGHTPLPSLGRPAVRQPQESQRRRGHPARAGTRSATGPSTRRV
jgi:hypothetical protein